MMKKSKILIGVVLSILMLLSVSCSSEPKKRVLPLERLLVDSLLISHVDSMYAYPQQMRIVFRNAQKELQDSIGYYKLEIFIGYCFYLENHKDSVEAIHKRTLKFCQRSQEAAALEAICWNHRAAILLAENQSDSALICLQQAYDALYRSDDRRELTSVCINIGNIHRTNGNLPQSATYYHKALFAADSLHSHSEYFAIYSGLAQTYSDLYNFTLADYYFDLAEKYSVNGIEYDKIFFYSTKANSLYFQQKYTESLQCFQKAYNITKQFEDRDFEVPIEINFGELYTLLNKPDSAHYYLDKANAYLSKAPFANRQQLFYLNSLYANLALQENDLITANNYLSKPYDPQSIAPTYIFLHNKRLMEYYAKKKDFEKAYYYREKVEAYDDSLRNVRNVSNISEIGHRYSQDTTLLKRDIIIADNKTQLVHQQGIITISVSLLIIFILSAISVILYIRRKNECKYNKQMAMVAELRMENIRNRISPHYVFNVLNAIMPTFKQYSGLEHPLQLLIEVLRGNLLASDKIAVELKEEIGLVKNYIRLRQETNSNTVDVVWKIQDHIPMQTLIPSMIIQIPVENALKYAFEGLQDKSNQLSICILQTEIGLTIYIEDNGYGYDPGKYTESKRGTGTGLKVLFRTIELLNSKNQQKASFEIQNITSENNDKHGTQVKILIPFNYQFKF